MGRRKSRGGEERGIGRKRESWIVRGMAEEEKIRRREESRKEG